MNLESSERNVDKGSRLKTVGHVVLTGVVLATAVAVSRCFDDGVREQASPEDFHKKAATSVPVVSSFVASVHPEMYCEFDVGSEVYIGVGEPILHPETGASSPICEEYPVGMLQPVYADELDPNPILDP